MFLVDIRLKKCVLKLLTLIIFYFILFAIDISLFLDQYKTQKMCDKVIDDFLPALKFAPDWFVLSKMIKKLSTDLYADEGLLFLMKILIMSYFLVMKWVFLL